MTNEQKDKAKNLVMLGMADAISSAIDSQYSKWMIDEMRFQATRCVKHMGFDSFQGICHEGKPVE